MTDLTLDVEHDNSTDTLEILGADALGDADAPSLQSARIERRLIRQPDSADTASVTVYRDAWSEVEADLDRTNDRLVVREGGSIIFGGRLKDTERRDVTVSVLIDGPKRDAIDAEPSGPNDVYPPQDDSALITNEILPRVPTVDAGTIETVASVSFSEAHASPGKSLTKLARDTGAEVRYRTTDSAFEVDYVSRLGSDRTAETLSPATATIIGDPRVRERVTENVTHVRVLGAGEGTGQVEAEAVAPSYDPATDREVYRQRTDKDIQNSGRAQTLADTLVAEYDGSQEYVEVEAELPPSVAPTLGDEFTAKLPTYNIDEVLRVVETERRIDGGGDRYRVVLSNRERTRSSGADQSAVSLDSLSEGNPGQYYALADGEGFDPVAPGEPYEFSFFRPPDTIGELRAVLRVESREYRLRSSLSGHSHSVDIDEFTGSASNTDFQTIEETEKDFTVAGVSGGGGFQTVTSFTPSLNSAMVFADLYVADAGNDNSGTHYVRLRNQSSGTTFGSDRVAFDSTADGTHVGIIPENTSGDTVAWEIDPRSTTKDFLVGARFAVVGRHNHTVDISTTETTETVSAVDPGINTIAGETPSNVAVDVAGTTVASGLAHPIDASIDVSGELSDGRNSISISSDSLGELRATLEYEAIKNADSR